MVGSDTQEVEAAAPWCWEQQCSLLRRPRIPLPSGVVGQHRLHQHVRLIVLLALLAGTPLLPNRERMFTWPGAVVVGTVTLLWVQQVAVLEEGLQEKLSIHIEHLKRR